MRPQAYAPAFDEPPNVAIRVTGELTVDRLIAELRSRPAVWGMQELVVQGDLPIADLLTQAPRLFGALCPMLAPSGTVVTIAFDYPGWVSWLRNINRICPRAILHR